MIHITHYQIIAVKKVESLKIRKIYRKKKRKKEAKTLVKKGQKKKNKRLLKLKSYKNQVIPKKFRLGMEKSLRRQKIREQKKKKKKMNKLKGY